MTSEFKPPEAGKRPIAPRVALRLPRWLSRLPPDVGEEVARVQAVERDLGLPVRGAMLLILAYYLFFSPWFRDAELLREGVHEVVRWFFLFYAVVGLTGGLLLAGMSELPYKLIREVVLVLALTDAFFLGALTTVTGGYDSILFWVFVVLIVRNALSMPEAARQILVNLIVTCCYLSSGAAEAMVTSLEIDMLDPETIRALWPMGPEEPTEPVILRGALLLLLTACCYGVEVLFERQQRIEEEAREFAQRQQQLESAGRLAAEIAHQLKNPLGVINNAAYTLQRTLKEGKTITQQIQIIREEVERSDRIITELMGYARLVDGKVERLSAEEELEEAVRQVFPPAARFDVEVRRSYTPALPPLLAQKGHVSQIFINLLQNAREAMNGKGHLRLATGVGEDLSIRITIEDDGPGIPPPQLDRVFEAYYTTKEKGTGLGLAIVKHNAELYGGTVNVESELGKGTRFILQFPARTVMRLRR
jgi:signal transduction histidine kinase